MQKKYPHKLARRIPKKQAKVKKKDEKMCWIKKKTIWSADIQLILEKKQSKKPNKL